MTRETSGRDDEEGGAGGPLAQMHAAVDSLYARYRGNEGSLAKLTQYVTQSLQCHMEAYEKDVERRALAKKQTSEMQRDLIQRFMTQSNYYYSPVTEMFFAYHDSATSGFVPVTQDYVCLHIHKMLTSHGCTTSVKYQVSRLILKEIKGKKERNIVNAIPTSATIQRVLGLFLWGDSALSKNDVKYFMTVVGDCILKKNVGLFYFLSPRMKVFMRELSNRCYEYLGCDSMLRQFKYKFSGDHHPMRDCRLLMKHCFHNDCLPVAKCHMLDLICVATHYSSRYLSGEDFLHSRAESFDCGMAHYVHYFKNKTSCHAILSDFVGKMLVPTTDCAPPAAPEGRAAADVFPSGDGALNSVETVTWKNMLFLWKRYCEGLCIPSVMYRNQLRSNLAHRFEYDEESECFMHVTSPHEPVVRLFLQFWQECAVFNQHSTTSTDVEYEVEEICGLFRAWNKGRERPGRFEPTDRGAERREKDKSNCSLNESLVSKLIQHYYEDHVTVEDDKYIYGVDFPIWDKPRCITDALREIYRATSAKPPSSPSHLRCPQGEAALGSSTSGAPCLFAMHDLYSMYQNIQHAPQAGAAADSARTTATAASSSAGGDAGTYGTPPSSTQWSAPASAAPRMVASMQYMHKYMRERHESAMVVNEENPQMSTVNLTAIFGGGADAPMNETERA